MSYVKYAVIWLFVIDVVVESVGITIDGVKCGQKVCKIEEYCNEIHAVCDNCSNICNSEGPNSHNYDRITCEEKCQDYLHDQRYVQKSEFTNDYELKATVLKLSKLITVTLLLLCFMLLVLGCIFCFQLYKWKIKKQITIKMIRDKFFKKPQRHTETVASATEVRRDDERKHDLRLDLSHSNIHSEDSPVTVSTSINRRPAEDSTLDYAYDNPTLTR